MERRSVLKVGALGSLLLAVGGVSTLALWPGDTSVQPKRPLLVLSPSSFPVLVAVASRVLVGTTANPLEIAHRVDATLRFTSSEGRVDVNRLFGLLENALGGVLLRGSARPFTLLSEAEQDAALTTWKTSDVALLRGAYQALRKLCLAAHYASADAFVEVGYPGPSLNKPEVPAITARGSLVVVENAAAEVMP